MYYIFFVFYASSLGNGEIGGRVMIHDNTLSSYIYGYGYVEWVITKRDEHINEHQNTIDAAIYELERAGFKSVMYVNEDFIVQHIMTDPPIRITMLRHKRNKQLNSIIYGSNN